VRDIKLDSKKKPLALVPEVLLAIVDGAARVVATLLASALDLQLELLGNLLFTLFDVVFFPPTNTTRRTYITNESHQGSPGRVRGTPASQRV
jgi:hypothetical protein